MKNYPEYDTMYMSKNQWKKVREKAKPFDGILFSDVKVFASAFISDDMLLLVNHGHLVAVVTFEELDKFCFM